MSKHRVLLAVLLLGTVGAWFVLSAIERSHEPGPNYTLIEDGLYMGGWLEAPPPRTGAVLSLCRVADPYKCDSHLSEPIVDSEPAPDLDWLRRVVKFIDAKRRAGVTTYVHCRNGISRAGMVTTAYLMFEHGWTRDKALAFIRTKRPQVRPNPAFMERLLDWERALKEKPAVGAASLRDCHKGRAERGSHTLVKGERMVAEQAQGAEQIALAAAEYSFTVTEWCERMPPGLSPRDHPILACLVSTAGKMPAPRHFLRLLTYRPCLLPSAPSNSRGRTLPDAGRQ
jgi:hypothetical protein